MTPIPIKGKGSANPDPTARKFGGGLVHPACDGIVIEGRTGEHSTVRRGK